MNGVQVRHALRIGAGLTEAETLFNLLVLNAEPKLNHMFSALIEVRLIAQDMLAVLGAACRWMRPEPEMCSRALMVL